MLRLLRTHLAGSCVTVAVLLAACLLVGASSAAAQYFGKNRVQYRDFDWQIYHSPHFDVYYYKAEEHLLQKTVSFAESAYDELSRVFDFQIQEPTPLIVYLTHSAFLQNNIIVNGVPEGAQAFATPNRFRMVLPLDLPDPELLGLIKHELTHIFQYHILFRGRLGAGLRSAPPQWFMEGMASYMADDEGPADRKFMVDAVVNDNIPSINAQGGGFLAYRFGHKVFDFIEERWGKEAILDLIYEYRNTIGSRIDRAIERTFRMDGEDFDAEFRRWLRSRYLPELLETGEPGDFGRPFRLEPNSFGGQELSPAASPSGDLVAAITTDKGEVDISLFDAKNRRRIGTLTKGFDKEIREIVSQFISTGRGAGRDLAFSPDGNFIAAFGRREAGRALILIDVLNGGLAKIIEMGIEQQLSPTWSPDGSKVAFAGSLNGQFDIFEIDVDSFEIRNVTNDEVFDAAPAYSPDGRWLAYTAWVGEHAQLFRLDRSAAENRYQLTDGQYDSKEPVFSTDGRRIYFTSDKTGAENIYGLHLERGEVTKYTNAVTACDRPTVLALPSGGDRLVYTGYWKGRFDLYMTDVEESLEEPEPVMIPEQPVATAEIEQFEPDIEVSIDEESKASYGGGRFFLEDIQNFIGVDTNQIFRGRVILSFSDYLGDRRITANIAAEETFSDFIITYANLRKRWQWAASLYDIRFFSPFIRRNGEIFEVDRDEFFRLTGVEYRVIYPFNFHNRVEFSGSYNLRDTEGFILVNQETGEVNRCNQFNPLADCTIIREPGEDDYPQLTVAFVSDNTIFNQWGPFSGHRVRVAASYAPDLDESGTLTSRLTLDARKYIPITRRSNLAMRLFVGQSDGNFPDLFFLGGIDTIRGFDFRDIAGTSAFHGNFELRFPLIDQLAFPGLGSFQGIRGVIFLDIGGAWFDDVTGFRFFDREENQLQDAVAAFGYGISARIFGFSANWDFSKRTNFGDTQDDAFETNFWIGRRF